MTCIWTPPARLHLLTTLKELQTAICDSGTARDMFQDTELVFDRQPLSPAITITLGNGHTLRATENGSVQLNVLIVPGLINNLISTSATPSMYTWDIDSTAA